MKRALTLRRYYDGTWVVLLGLLFAMAGTSGTISWVILLVGLFFLLWALRPDSWAASLPSRLAFLAGLFAMGLFRYTQEKDIAWVFSHILFGLLPLVLPRRDRFGGYWTSLITTVVWALVCLLAGDSVWEFILFLVFASTLVFSLNAAHLYFYVGPAESSFRYVPRHYFLPFIGSAGLGLVVGGLLFVFFPRTLQWQNPFGLRQKNSTTGYSGRVALGGVSIQENQSVAMVLESPDREWLQSQAPFLLMKGNTLDRFDGVQWGASDDTRIDYQGPQDLHTHTSFQRRFVRLRVYREPHSTQAVFLPGIVHDAVFPREVLGGLKVDLDHNLFREARGELRYSYSLAVSPIRRPMDLSRWNRRELTRALIQKPRFLDGGVDRFLQVPQTVARAPYFTKWIGEALDPKPQDGIGVFLHKLTAHFRENFRVGYESAEYKVDSLESFLGPGKYGHCEYFATATALALRTLGVPTRLVLGYRGGTFNNVSQVLEVREANAHAWVEVYVPSAGWLPYDPTPVTVRQMGGEWWQNVGLVFTAVRFWLERYVVDYNSQTQARLYQGIRSTTWARGASWTPTERLWNFGLVLLLSAAVGGATWAWRRRKRQTPHLLPSYYREFQTHLRRQGWTREPQETWAAFHQRLLASGQFGRLLAEVADALERDLYSRRPTSPIERKRLVDSLRVLGVRGS